MGPVPWVWCAPRLLRSTTWRTPVASMPPPKRRSREFDTRGNRLVAMFWRNQEIGGFGSRKDLANETRILDIADASSSAPALAKGASFSRLPADYANRLSPLEQEGRSGRRGIPPKLQRCKSWAFLTFQANRPEACYLASMPGGCQS